MKDPGDISINDFNYDLPQDRIPHFPAPERDSSKLLVYRGGTISQDLFQNISQHLPTDSLLVFNDTRVIRARLNFFTIGHRAIEIFCLEPAAGSGMFAAMQSAGSVNYNCLVGNLRRWKNGFLTLEKEGYTLKAEILERKINYVVVTFSWTPATMTFAEVLEFFGSIPIPPYLQRKEEKVDSERYQTVYASEQGSVAAPTAGLHFTSGVIEKLTKAGIRNERITLHVGAGTFKPVKAEKLSDHEMHSEWMDVSFETLSKLADVGNGKLIAVGTTSLRTLESLYWMGVKLSNNPNLSMQELQIKQWEVYSMKSDLTVNGAFSMIMGWMQAQKLKSLVCQTQILIAPPYRIKVCDGLITNFHQPRSTLLLLVAAFVGEKWKTVYEYALHNDFRFLSYGDSSVLLK